MAHKKFLFIFFLVFLSCAYADNQQLNVKLDLPKNTGEWAPVLKILIFMTLLSFIPAILLTMTSFTRILIVLSFTRQAFGVQSLPPNQILIGLAIFLTIFVMTPVWNGIYQNSYLPYQKEEINTQEALSRSLQELRTFMLKHVREKDLALMIFLSKSEPPKTVNDIPISIVIPAFVISELTIAFQMGLLILIPFFIIDILVASTLLAMGMMMLPPTVIAIPFKVMLFIMVDGWHLVAKTLVVSFG
ncbi:flagellar type III secretion system pore protein FliP [Candidatus Uabimicrobium amorphum]|uniref:Flagellar biosynthetic protein FliP n=1 Tax=Uabimicrobium amorphum TaxID=2596890 RepID=A0A5S9F4C3_UABAM|nr:flagellar type III secretion system pore protein FliP [Candidatus Uabimicrobium amorphum]BBM84993.1 flagellar biosynthetic protein FliP [Candidatus Uabimicrobium amorphum]